MSSLTYISQQITIYFGIPTLVAGILGGVLNILVFLSLRTFRQNSCAFYLTIMSIVNIGQLFTGLLSRIMISGYSIDWASTSPFYCKLRYFLVQACTLISLTCICLATIDQYFATSSNLRWQQWCTLKVAYCLTAIISIFWCLHGIVYLIYFSHIYIPATGQSVCTITNTIFGRYNSYGYFLILTGFLPISITILFALLAFRNVRQLAHQAVPVVRRELEKQLTTMVLVHVAFNSIALLPSNIVSAIQSANSMGDAEVTRRLQFAFTLALLIYYLNFIVSQNQFFLSDDDKRIFIVESILHLHMCIRTISSTINPCFISNSF